MLADRLPIAAAVLRERRRGLLGWAIALAAVSAIYVSFYPAIGDGAEMQALIDNMPEGMVSALGYDQIGTAAGYLESTIFGLLGPALLLVFAIGAGARLVGGEEEQGTLELELTHPVSRRRIVGERLAVLVASALALVVVVAAVSLALVAALDLDVAAGNLVATAAGLVLLTLAFGLIALAAGAATGRRSLGLAVGAGLAVLAYVADAVAGLVEWGGWLEAASPFAWYLGKEPLATGWDPGGLALLAALALVAGLVAVVTFDGRDVA